MCSVKIRREKFRGAKGIPSLPNEMYICLYCGCVNKGTKTEMEHLMDQGEEEKENNVEKEFENVAQQSKKENENKLKLQV